MKKKVYDSIIFKLTAAIVIIFSIMLIVTMYLINRKQSMVIDAVIESFETNMPFTDKSVVLFVDSSRIQFTSDFTLYLFIVMSLVLILGSLAFAFIIKKILRPLKSLQESMAKVDIDRPKSFENLRVLDSSSTEIVELSASFDRMLKKIYADYKRQKDFSSNVAHELRTPIAVMRSQIDLYKEKNKDPGARKLIRVLDANVDKLNSLVDAILSLRKKEEIKKVDLNLADLIDEIAFDLEDKAAERNIDLSYKAEDLYITTDDSLLQRLIFNIVDNAIKYNRPGGSVEIFTRDLGDFAEIFIEDTGIGISKNDKEKIFDLFYQVDSSRRGEGFGIGLSLSKTIADMLRAEIAIKENDPQGTIFIIKIPKTLS